MARSRLSQLAVAAAAAAALSLVAACPPAPVSFRWASTPWLCGLVIDNETGVVLDVLPAFASSSVRLPFRFQIEQVVVEEDGGAVPALYLHDRELGQYVAIDAPPSDPPGQVQLRFDQYGALRRMPEVLYD